MFSKRLEQRVHDLGMYIHKIIIWHENYNKKIEKKEGSITCSYYQKFHTGRTIAVIWGTVDRKDHRYVGICRERDWKTRKDRPVFMKEFGKNIALARALDVCSDYCGCFSKYNSKPAKGFGFFTDIAKKDELSYLKSIPKWMLERTEEYSVCENVKGSEQPQVQA